MLSIREIHNLKPPEHHDICEWTERYRVLPLATSAEAGRIRLSRTPFMRQPLTDFTDPYVQEIVLCTAAQVSKTTLLENAIGYSAACDPGPTMLFLADQNTAENISQNRIQVMFQTCEPIKQYIMRDRMTRQEMTLSNGFNLCIGWASSIAMTASRSIRYLFLDEIDKPGYSIVGSEGSALHRLHQRTETFSNRKIIKCSTPTLETGNIWKELQACDARYYWCCPCPNCGQVQPLFWSQREITLAGNKFMTGSVVWEKGNPIDSARYQCAFCPAKWTTAEKNLAVEAGEYISEAAEIKSRHKVGYHINRINSLFEGGRLENLVRDWHDCQGDIQKLQSFINSVLAEPFVQRVGSIELSHLETARQSYPRFEVPADAVALTAGIDVQQTGFWYVIRAWARDFTSWLVDYGYVIEWEDLEKILFETEYHRAGSEYERVRLWRGLIDTGGGKQEGAFISRTEEVYHWIRRNGRGRGATIWGSKGASHPLTGKIQVGKLLERAPSGKPIPGGIQIISIDTDKCKDAFLFRLEQAKNQMPGGMYVFKETGDDWFKQVSAEEKRIDRSGKPYYEQVRRDNHLLDCEVLALAAADREMFGGITVIRSNAYSNTHKIEQPQQNNQPTPEAAPAQPGQNPFLGRRVAQTVNNPYLRRG